MINFSVVIPLYNKASHISDTLHSVFNQSSLPEEVIVVDDGSTDGGPEIVTRKFGQRVVMVRQKNSGVSAARNAGIRAASYPYVCLLDGDDEWLPEYLHEIRTLIQDFPQATFYAARRFFRDEHGTTLSSALGVSNGFRGLVPDFPLTFSKGYGLISSSSVCLKKEIFDSGLHFPEGEGRGEDLYYWLRLGMTGQLAFTAKALVQINLDAENRSKNVRGCFPFHFRWFLDNRQIIQAHPLAASVRKFIVRNAIVTTYGAIESRKKETAWMIFKAFFQQRDPLALVLLPALLFPRVILGTIKNIRRRLRS